MPLLQLELAATPAPTPAQIQALQTGLTRLMADLLGKQAGLTVVQVRCTPPQHWAGDGSALPADRVCASLVVHVTAGTNSAAEQAAFVAEAHALIAHTLQAPAGAPVYVIVQDHPATAWGYDGQTQQQRRLAGSGTPAAGAPRTLRAMAGLPLQAHWRTDDTALLLIDFQREYSVDGRLPLPALRAAAQRAQRLSDGFDAAGAAVVHIHHVAQARRGALFAADEPGVAPLVVPAVQPRHQVFRKQAPSAFAGTELQAWLQARGIRRVVIAGAMTHNCVDSTARAAFHLGYEVLVASDACATRSLPTPDGGTLGAEQVQQAALGALADRHALVLPVDALLQGWSGPAVS